MRARARRSTVLAVLMLLSTALFAAEGPPGTLDLEYPFPISVVEMALRQLGAYTGARLPTLDGFIKTERAQLPQYERPYHEYKIELLPKASDRTLVRVRAAVSAWYQDPEGRQTGYQTLESNGRLESDLLDRLGEFLNKSQSKIITDPGVFAKQLATVRQQESDTQRRIAELEEQLQALQAANARSNTTEYVSVIRFPAPVFSTPEEHAVVLLRARSEDEFEVIERHVAWVRVGLDEGRTGWLKGSQVKSNTVLLTGGRSGRDDNIGTVGEGFSVIRETVSEFSGDWARLKGKRTLYVSARPEGSVPDVAAGKKVRFVEATFKERYRELSHDSQNSVEGIVVIFLDQRGGVAAASLEDISDWAEGRLSRMAFLKKCSLDPPGAFEDSRAGAKAALP